MTWPAKIISLPPNFAALSRMPNYRARTEPTFTTCATARHLAYLRNLCHCAALTCFRMAADVQRPNNLNLSERRFHNFRSGNARSKASALAYSPIAPNLALWAFQLLLQPETTVLLGGKHLTCPPSVLLPSHSSSAPQPTRFQLPLCYSVFFPYVISRRSRRPEFVSPLAPGGGEPASTTMGCAPQGGPSADTPLSCAERQCEGNIALQTDTSTEQRPEQTSAQDKLQRNASNNQKDKHSEAMVNDK